MGWTVYNYQGGFGYRTGWINGPIPFDQPSTRGDAYPLMNQALFGGARPEQQ